MASPSRRSTAVWMSSSESAKGGGVSFSWRPTWSKPLLDGATFVVGEPPGPIEAARVGLVDADLFRAKTSIEIDGSAQPLQGRRGLFPEPASPELQWKYPE